MNVCLISCFRNAALYIGRYFEQVAMLRMALAMRSDRLQLVLGEGDSLDDTRHLLDRLGGMNLFRATIVDCAHGGPEFGSVVDIRRFRQLAHVGRCLWAAIPADADAVLYVESDLIWDAATLVKLLDRLEDCPAVAPMVMLQREGWSADTFYDVWAFRKYSKMFNPQPPYFDGWPQVSLVPLGSAGSCVAVRAALARQLVPDERVFPGICEQIYYLNGSVWLDPTLSVYHR